MIVYGIKKETQPDVSFNVPRLDVEKARLLSINGILFRKVGFDSTGFASVRKSFSMLDLLDVDAGADDSHGVGGATHRR
jgi:hypothetical protein